MKNCCHRQFLLVGIHDDRTGHCNTILMEMAKKAIPAGIGAIGKTKMKNLHPSYHLNCALLHNCLDFPANSTNLVAATGCYTYNNTGPHPHPSQSASHYQHARTMQVRQ